MAGIKNNGKKWVQIILNDRKEANMILNNIHISKLHQIKLYIPKHLLISTGIVRGVPTDLSNAELLVSCRVQGDIKIEKLERMTLYEKDTQTVKLSLNIKIEQVDKIADWNCSFSC